MTISVKILSDMWFPNSLSGLVVVMVASGMPDGIQEIEGKVEGG